ncbi:MAG TPA: type II toxin-antitoxin system VapC family toxin [Thermoanaerobaculia bacterium]|nr:type II toxin-antitoxin system VapC family toxin [Thermoanaerobaculia bacterium]
MTASRLLLDTHVFLWWRGEPARLGSAVRDRIATADIVFVSVASAWEAAIKASLGRIELPDTIEAGVLASGFEKLLITFSHAERVTALPPHHRDPFDRMLVAQAQSEGLTLVTHDRLLEPYEVEILWA